MIRSLAIIVAVACATGCGEWVLEDGNASVEYPCDDPDLWAARLQACDRDEACEGRLALKGEFDGQPLRLDSPVLRTVYQVNQRPAGDILDEISVAGTSPYVIARLQIKSIGHPLAETPESEFGWKPQATQLPDELNDTVIEGSIRFDNGRENQELKVLGSSGAVFIGIDADGRVYGRLSAKAGLDGSPFEGCFLAAPSVVRVGG